MITFFGLAHMVDATRDLRLGSGGVGWDDNVLWPCTHGRCDTRPEAGVEWGGMITFFGLEHIADATQDLRLGSGGVG